MKYLRFIKIEHTLFSLPIVFAGVLLSLRLPPQMPWPLSLSWWKIFWIVCATAGARAAGFGFNRILDAKFDARNPRTAQREIPAGILSIQEAWSFTAACCALYFASAALISPLCFYFSPLPILMFYIYPYLKRFTCWTHLGLGLAWGSAPLGAWLAARAQWSGPFLPALLLASFCVFWVAGFDILYSLLDEEFDRKMGLYSMPAHLGKTDALRLSEVFHAAALLFLAYLVARYFPNARAYGLLGLIGFLLLLGHCKIKAPVLTPAIVDFAFFKVNAAIGFLVFFLFL